MRDFHKVRERDARWESQLCTFTSLYFSKLHNRFDFDEIWYCNSILNLGGLSAIYLRNQWNVNPTEVESEIDIFLNKN
jgi:hypothetical protein